MQTAGSYSATTSFAPRMRAHSARLPAPPIPALESQWALFLDVDGTLLEFAPTPDSVKIPDGLVDLLGKLQQRLDGALALVSGRRIEALDRLFAPLSLPCVGLHGFEWRDSAGKEHCGPLDNAQLSLMRKAAERLADKLPSVLIEDKIFSIAFHFRKARQHEALLKNEVLAIARDTGFILQSGVDVYEIRPPYADKGTALEKLMRDPLFDERLPIYIGDDITDEQALFAAQRYMGVGIHVGSVLSHAARFGLPSPGAVLHWLYRWEEQLA